MRSVIGRPQHLSFKALSSGEWPSLSVSVKATTRDPYGSSRPEDFVELRIGWTKRARIVRLEPKMARQLAYALVEQSAKVQANQERARGYEDGLTRKDK